MSASGNYIVASDIDNWPVSVEATEDFETTAIDTSTDKITVANDIATCTELKFSSTGAVPSPLVVGIVYYAINVDATHIKVATTPVLAAAGTAIDLTDVGSGTHTLDIGSGSSETERQEVIDSVEHLVEKITRDYFYEKDFVIYRDGNGKDKLYLGLTANILSVSEVLLFGVELSSSWYTFDNDSIYLDPDVVTGDELTELLLRMRYETNLFPKGTGNVKITGTYGWLSCPAAIKRAAVILCRYENDETLYTKYDDFVSEKLGDMAQSRGDKKYLTGIQEADRILRNYIRKKPMFGVA